MMIMGLIAYNGPTYWSGAGLSVVSLLTSWLSIKTLNDLLKMRKQMKKIPIDEQKQKWYPRMKIKNIIASIFIPFYLLVLYTAVIFAIFGVLIFFEI
jgi:hypothetical protein